MRPLILSRERLARIHRVLAAHDGVLTVRDFARGYSVFDWEIDQATSLGWLGIEIRKPRTGRPSKVAKTVSENPTAKLPAWRSQIEKPISIRHERFALFTVYNAIKGGTSFLWRIPPFTDAYLRAFPEAKKRRAATASMSRLLRHPHVFAARQWYYARLSGEVPQEPCPETVSEIWRRLREAGSWREKYAMR